MKPATKTIEQRRAEVLARINAAAAEVAAYKAQQAAEEAARRSAQGLSPEDPSRRYISSWE